MMPNESTPDLLTDTLHTFFDVNGFGEGWLERLKSYLNNPAFPNRAEQFKHELAEAVLLHTITPAEYERLTNEDFDSQEDLETWLREVWQHLYGDEPVILTEAEAVATR